MLFLWFLLFVSWPVAEIAIFVKVGQSLGWPGAILLTTATGAAGAYLMRIQGFAAMNRILQSADRGEPPVGAVLDGIGIFAAGVLLLLPGFLTDIVGLLLFIPPLRRRLIACLLFRRSPKSRDKFRQPQGGRAGPASAPGKGGFRKSENVVDAEFETVEPAKKPKSAAETLTDDRSPWRQP